jgi:chromosome partitioning protein
MKPTVIAVVCSKGGTSKSTLCLSVGAALAERGYKTLLCDLDPQGTLAVGTNRAPDPRKTIAEVLTPDGLTLDDVILSTDVERLDLAPALGTLGATLAVLPTRSDIRYEYVLADAIERMTGEYDFVIIDTPGNETLAAGTIAMTAADYLVIPTLPAPEGVRRAFETIRRADLVRGTAKRPGPNPSLTTLGIAVCQLPHGTTLARDLVAAMAEHATVLSPAIPRTVAVDESFAAQVPFLTYAEGFAPGSAARVAADAFRALTSTIVEATKTQKEVA